MAEHDNPHESAGTNLSQGQPDAFEEALRNAKAMCNAEDAALAGAEQEKVLDEAETARQAVRKQLLQLAVGLKPNDPYEHILRQASFAGLGAGDVETLARTIAGSTRLSIASVREDARRIAKLVKQNARKKESEEANRRAAHAASADMAAGAAAAADQDVQKVTDEYPLSDATSFVYRRMPDGHIVLHEIYEDQHNHRRTRPVCTPFTVDSTTRSPRDASGKRIRVRDLSGARRVVYADGYDFGTPMGRGRVISRMTAEEFAVLAPTERNQGIVADILSNARPGRIITVVAHPGFLHTPGGDCFVNIDGRVIGDPGVEVELNHRDKLASARKGTFARENEAIASLALWPGMPNLALACISSFAGPIIGRVNMLGAGKDEGDSDRQKKEKEEDGHIRNQALNLHGVSTGGKSVMQQIAVSRFSPIETGSGSLFQSANVTVNNCENKVAWANGTMLALDELAMMPLSDQMQLIFKFNQGAGKGRNSRDGQPLTTLYWNTLMLLSSERSVASAMAEDQRAMLTGARVRLLEIPMLGIPELDKADVARLDRTIDVLRANHGHGGPAFIEHLLTWDPAELREGVNACTEQLSREGAIAVERRAMATFGLLLAAGMLARQQGLLPAALDIEATVRWAIEQFLGEAALDTCADAVENIRTEIARHWERTIVPCGRVGMGGNLPVDGYFDDKGIYLLKPTMEKYGGGRADVTTVAAHLRKNALLLEEKLEPKAKSRGGRHNFTRRVPHHHGVTAYPLRRDKLAPVDKEATAAEVGFSEKTLKVMHDATFRESMRKQFGDDEFERRIKSAEETVAAQRAKLDGDGSGNG